MPSPPAVRIGLASLCAAVALAGCSGSHGGTGGTAAGSGASSAAPASGSSTGPLSRSQFLSRMNAVCKTVSTTIAEVKVPSSATDFAAIDRYATVVMQLFPHYMSQARALVARTADRQALQQDWLRFEQSDYDAHLPALRALQAAAAAHDRAGVQSAGAALAKGPDHSSQLDAYLKHYGLTDCAALESV